MKCNVAQGVEVDLELFFSLLVRQVPTILHIRHNILQALPGFQRFAMEQLAGKQQLVGPRLYWLRLFILLRLSKLLNATTALSSAVLEIAWPKQLAPFDIPTKRFFPPSIHCWHQVMHVVRPSCKHSHLWTGGMA